MSGLDHLIHPVDNREFLSNYWGRRAIHIPGDSDKFPDLPGWQTINQILNHNRPSMEGIQLIHERKPLSANELRNLSGWLSKGATLLITSINQLDSRVASLASLLGRDLNTPVNANSYVSSPSKQGFDTHYDGHDVFVVQLAGSKKWTVFEPGYPSPLERQTAPRGTPPRDDPYLECELSEGDVLYIPRGHWHHALAVTPSFHLSLGPRSRSAIDFMEWLMGEFAEKDEWLRRDFPVAETESLGGDVPDEALDTHLDKFRTQLTALIGGEELKDLFLQFCMRTNPLRREVRLPDMALLAERITPRTVFQMDSAQKAVVRYQSATSQAEILVRGHVLKLEQAPEWIVRECFEREGLVTGETLLAAGDRVEWEVVKQFLLAMYDSDVIRLAKDQPSNAYREPGDANREGGKK
jgi:ribosomal protein L16 Arg81 hydroxylase